MSNDKGNEKNTKFAWSMFTLYLIVGIIAEILQLKGIVKKNDVHNWPVEAIGSLLCLLAYKNFKKKNLIKAFCLVIGLSEAIVCLLCLLSIVFGVEILGLSL